MNFKKIKEITFFRFLIAGAFNTAFGVTFTFFLIKYSFLHYSINLLIGHTIGTILSYINNSYNVFNVKFSFWRVFLFIGVYSFIYFFTLSLMKIIIYRYLISPEVAFVIIMPISVIISYFFQKKMIFLNSKRISTMLNKLKIFKI